MNKKLFDCNIDASACMFIEILINQTNKILEFKGIKIFQNQSF